MAIIWDACIEAKRLSTRWSDICICCFGNHYPLVLLGSEGVVGSSPYWPQCHHSFRPISIRLGAMGISCHGALWPMLCRMAATAGSTETDFINEEYSSMTHGFYRISEWILIAKIFRPTIAHTEGTHSKAKDVQNVRANMPRSRALW